MKIDIETLRKTKGIGNKTLERIIRQHHVDNEIKAFESKYIPSDKYKIQDDTTLWQGDCLELMSHIPDNSVNMVLCDLPYTTRSQRATWNTWDTPLDLNLLFKHYERILQDNGVLLLFGNEHFGVQLIQNTTVPFRYSWIWVKERGTGFLNCNRMPLRQNENIYTFYAKEPLYNPQKTQGKPYKTKKGSLSNNYCSTDQIVITENSGDRYPTNILEYKRELGHHPTQKPVPLLEYLIKTYTDKDMLILDNTMGSGSTGVAAKNLNRRFIGIELDKDYFNIARDRIEN